MRKFFTAILFSLLLPAGVAMAMSASDKKDDKKEGGKDKGHEPVVIIIWEPTWPPIFREFQVQSTVEPYSLINGTEM